MILVKDTHDTFREICHIFTHKESQMTSLNVFVVDKSISLKFVSEPVCISLVCNNVMSASKDGNWDT